MNEFNFQSGANLDTRSQSEKDRDPYINEIVAAVNPVNWIEKSKFDWRRFPDQNQDGSGSCVEQTIRKIASVLLWLKEGVYVTFSGAFYQLRSNKSDSGMSGVEAFDIWAEHGIPLEQLTPSENMSDAQMDSIKVEQYEKDIAAVFKISKGGHIGIPNGDFETAASVIQTTGKALMAWFFFNSDEWSREIPEVIDNSLTVQSGLRHSVAIVDFFLYNGKKYLLAEDSAHFGGHTYHLISKEFFRTRNWFCRYPMNFKFQEGAQSKPSHHFSKVLEFGMSDDDIAALQDILKYEGFFPRNVESTGYYGPITAKGMYDWQVAHNIAPLSELDALKGRTTGNKSVSELNNLYG